MRTTLTKIGNSKGVILPASVLKQCGLGDEVEMQVEGRHIVLSPPEKPRQGWFEAIERDGADTLLLDESGNDFDDSDWTW